MEKKMENYKDKGRSLSRSFSSRKSLGSLKTKFKKFLSDHQAKAGDAEDISSNAGSDSDTDGRKTSSPLPDRSGEIIKSSGPGSSSDSDEESPSKLEKEKKSDSPEEKEKKKDSSKSSRKKLQLSLQQDRQELFRLPPLEETPPTSPQSNPRFSTGAQSDYGRLWTNVSAPNSPANLAHNFNVSYRGGDSSPVALVHSLSGRERGKHPSQLSEISYASPPSSSSLDLDVLGVNLEDMTASPSKTTPSLKPNGLPIVHHDEEQGVWRCGSCGWIYPNPNPSLRNRREHKNNCGEISNVQRWLGAQDIQDAPGKGAVELEEDPEVWEGSGVQDTLNTADEHPMGKFDGQDYNEGMSDRSADHHGSVDQGRLDDMESNGSPDAVGDQGNGGRSPSAAANPNEVEDQKLNRVLEWPTLDAGTKDQSSEDEMLSNGSTNYHEVADHNKLEDVSNMSTAHSGMKEVSKLDDSASFLIPEVENVTEEAVEVKADQEEATGSVESSQVFGSEVEAHESQLNQKSQEEVENDTGDVQVQPVNGNGTPEVENEKEEAVEVKADQEEVTGSVESSQVFGNKVEAHESQLNEKSQEEVENDTGDVQVQPANGNGKRSVSVVHSNGQDLGNGDNIEGFKEDENADQDSNDRLNHPDDIGLTGVPEVHSEQSVLTSDTGVGGGEGIDDIRNKDDLDNQIPGDGFRKEAVAVKAIEKTEPRVITHKGRTIVLAEVVREPDVMEPTLSKADLQSVETEIEKRDAKALKAVAPEGTNVDKVVPKLTEPSQNSSLETETDANTNGIVSYHSSERKMSESDHMGGSTRELPSKENGIRPENGGRVGGPPSPLEEAPKWMNSVMITSQDEGDTFTSVQKYWAGMTRSEYLLVEGKRSPSFGSCENIGFLSFRNGEGRRSPSPFSLSKSGDGEVQSSPSVASTYHSTVEDENEERAIPSLAAIQHDGNSSSSAHVDYDLEKVVHEQNTHDLICPVCGSDVTKRIILKKRKRTRVQEDDGRSPKAIMRQPGGLVEDQTPQVDESDNETWGCLACLSFFVRRGGGEERVSQALAPGAEGQTQSISGGPVETEQERVRCLPTLFRWGHETTEPELQVPLLGDTAREEVVGERSEPPPVNSGHVHEVPLDNDDEVSCFSYLKRPKSSDISKEEDNAEIAKPMPVSSGHVHEVPLDEDERVSCFSYLRSKHEPSVQGEATEELSISNLQPEIEDEAPNAIEQAEGVGKHGDELPDKDQESVIQLLDGIGVSQQRETVETEKCECLPFFAFSSFSVNTVTDTGSSTREFHPVEDPKKEGTSESLPASLPEFSWGKSSKYDLPPSPGNLSSHQEITSVIDRPEEAPTPLTREPQALEDASEKRSCNCLPELLPAFSWGPIPVYTHPHLHIDESAGNEQHNELSARSRTAALTQEPQTLEDANEKTKCNCLPDLLPAFSWGPIPVYTHPSLDTDESAEPEQHEEATPVIPTASVTQEPQLLGDVEEKETYNCLPELLPAFTWGPIPVYTHPPPDTYEFSGEEQYEEVSSASLSASETQEPHEDSGEKRSLNCLPELPTFSWRSVPENDTEIHSSSEATTGQIQEIPVDADEDSPSSRLKAETKESATCACLPLLLPAFHWGFTRKTYENGLREPLLPQDPPEAAPVLLDNTSTVPMQTTEIPDPVVQGLEEGLAVVPPKPVTVADPPSVVNGGERTEITESEEFYIEGIVSSRRTAKAEPREKPADVINSVNVHQSKYHFAVDIRDGQFTSTVEKLSPELPLLNISNSDAVSSTDSTSLSVGTSHEPGQGPVEFSQVAEGDLGDFEHLAQAIADLVEEDVDAAPADVSQPVETFLRGTFPAEEIEQTVEDSPRHEHLSWNCCPIAGVAEGREESQDESSRVDVSLATSETHVKFQRGQPSVDGTGDRCNCLPAFSLYDVFRDHHVSAEPQVPGTEVDDIRTPLLGRAPHKPDTVVEIDRTETSIAVEGATSAETAAEALAITQGQSPTEGERAPSEYLKSIVHGGLDVTLVSLGVVASGAGGDAKTITVVAIGLANLVFGLITHLSTIMSLYYNNRTQFQEEVGQGFIHGCLSLISFLFFGALSPTTYGFSFRHAKNKNYKVAATCLVALVSIVLLGAASARVKSKSATRVISILIGTGILAITSGYEAGNLVAQLLELYGFSSV